MGMVFGKVDVAEPAFDLLLKRGTNVATSYEIRRYGERFAAEVEYMTGNGENSPFGQLAKYIGVFGTPENEGDEKIAMTAPVVMEQSNNDSGTAISMTAPVVRAQTDKDTGKMKMQFMLPAKYDDMSKIPKPTNANIHIKELPPAVGAVHVYSGSFNPKKSRKIADQLTEQLQNDGVAITKETAMDNYQFWGYNPPFTIPALRRNEVWIELTEAQVDDLMQSFSDASVKN
uniref:SOUL heme-binding protein n=1 Tax=Attheya septentrionalis TaxID=420275 RepID=A0A7S2UQ64_9STRA|mmetsp:Transcript_4817/g.8466  ORF Transcript_4817/g.8466 Transcript_4817/m.8466 type:complete len:230 (+) Transcript_4817:183-872(+)|eukprot:CAMPEP_0198294632 /NCGR_PEP_ID=MMETSP1449-20131203/23414_1 /TAXON_ID=420275 /ORGANISM="Attheya septentrionalis, Strain CCMP2084" /LENGTH=229 /DNA_ID=CAMNT_0043994637 /DNA_START=83 /DNA_END=772 /DNA_ORIENTATION=-